MAPISHRAWSCLEYPLHREYLEWHKPFYPLCTRTWARGWRRCCCRWPGGLSTTHSGRMSASSSPPSRLLSPHSIWPPLYSVSWSSYYYCPIGGTRRRVPLSILIGMCFFYCTLKPASQRRLVRDAILEHGTTALVVWCANHFSNQSFLFYLCNHTRLCRLLRFNSIL